MLQEILSCTVKLLGRDYSTLGRSCAAVIISNIHSWFAVKCKSHSSANKYLSDCAG